MTINELMLRIFRKRRTVPESEYETYSNSYTSKVLPKFEITVPMPQVKPLQ